MRRRYRQLVPLVLTCGLIAGGGWASAVPGSAGDPFFPEQGNAGYDVNHYDVDLRFEPAAGGGGRIDAVAQVRARATRDLTSLNLDFVGLRVESVVVDGQSSPFSRDAGELVVTPQTPLQAGKRFVVEVSYDGVPNEAGTSSGLSSGWFSTSDGAIVLAEPTGTESWLPSNPSLTDKATYSFNLTAPEGVTAISNGQLLGRTTREDETTWHWSNHSITPSYAVMIGFGDFFMLDDGTRNGVRYLSFVDKTLPGMQSVTKQLPGIIAQLEKWFGRYPYSDAGMVIDDLQTGYALETQHRAFYPAFAPSWLIVHETAHQWFGNSVTPKKWRDIWLNEGFATYAEWLWSGHQGRATPREIYRAHYGNRDFDWKLAPRQVNAESLFDESVYVRGAMTLHALRERIGSAKFFRLVKAWHSNRRYRNGSTAEFQAEAEALSGLNLNVFFRDWLDRSGKPRGYGVTSKAKR